MSRNRRNQSTAVRFGPAVKALALCLFLGAVGIGYVWQKDQIIILKDRIQRTEQRYEQLKFKNDRFTKFLAAMQTPAELEARIKKNELGLIAPQPDQIVRLPELLPPGERAPNRGTPIPILDRSVAWVQP